jgi:hypothetical protein
LSAETIRKECFPVLSLKQVYGAILFYLKNQEETDACLEQAAKEEEEMTGFWNWSPGKIASLFHLS